MLTIKPAATPDTIAEPPARLPPNSGWWPQLVSLVRYLAQTEVHTYAFSVAANAILSLFPFIVMTWTIERQFSIRLRWRPSSATCSATSCPRTRTS